MDVKELIDREEGEKSKEVHMMLNVEHTLVDFFITYAYHIYLLVILLAVLIWALSHWRHHA